MCFDGANIGVSLILLWRHTMVEGRKRWSWDIPCTGNANIFCFVDGVKQQCVCSRGGQQVPTSCLNYWMLLAGKVLRWLYMLTVE